MPGILKWSKQGEVWVGEARKRKFSIRGTPTTCWNLYEIKEGNLILLEENLPSCSYAKNVAEMYVPVSKWTLLAIFSLAALCLTIEVMK